MNSLDLAELLCARLCHDLSGPVGAASAGAELFEDCAGSLDAETVGLVAGAAASAAARLKFFRAALGPEPSAVQPSGTLRDLMDSYLATQVSAASPGLVLAWADPPLAVEGATARLVLNLVLLAKDALPRGGRIGVEVAGGGAVRVIAHGEPAALSDEARSVLHDGQDPTGPRGAQAYFVRLLAERAGKVFNATVTPEGLALSVGITSPPSGVGGGRFGG